jgi:hypothetical protein
MLILIILLDLTAMTYSPALDQICFACGNIAASKICPEAYAFIAQDFAI